MANMKRFRNRNCRSSLPLSKISNRPEPASRRLAKAKDWIRYSDSASRETNTMPQWAGSCWYYLRFCDPGNHERFVGEEPERYWMGGRSETGNRRAESKDSAIESLRNPKSKSEIAGGVDLYIGGVEHAVLHLLYARFWHKVLFDLGYLSNPEPFQRLVNQGMILGEDSRKMSKRWGNVIDPLDVIDNLRRGRVPLLRDVHGPARADETVEHERGRRRLAFPRARLASDHGGKSGGRMGALR